MKIYTQKSRFEGPWSLKIKIKIVLWDYIWFLFCRWTPKNFNFWRLIILKIFGAKIYGNPFVHQRTIIHHPWNLFLHNRSCLGDRSVAYAVDVIELQENSTVAQEVYLCTATHDFKDETMPLKTDKIIIGKNSFVGARAFIMPGIKTGDNSIIGACSVVTKNVPNSSIAYGNPAKIKPYL